MSEMQKPFPCPECSEDFQAELSGLNGVSDLNRRAFLHTVGGTAAALALGSTAVQPVSAAAPPRPPKPAEELIRELFSNLTDAQKNRVLKPFNYAGPKGGGTPYRQRMFNAAIENITLGSVYTKPQQELVERIVRSMSSGEEGFRQISRNGRWDGSRTFDRTGALFFGNPMGKDPFAFVFAGHHLTVRCDGNTVPNAAFGGPIYYGHSPDGYSRTNIFYYQTREVLSVYEALSPAQRKQALIQSNPGEQEESVRFRAAERRPGILIGELSADQRQLVEKVMRTVLSPYRNEDVDEVMEIVKANGGQDQIKLGFYSQTNESPWDFWRLEGPGFVWNYRVLPHVHCFVNIAKL